MKRIEVHPEPLAGAIDAHAHTWSRELALDHPAVLDRAWRAGLEAIIEVGCDLPTSQAALGLSRQEPRIHPVLGLHPHDARHLDQQRADLEALAATGEFVAIGETGLDFYRNNSPPEDQYAAFTWQLDLARQHDLPVVIHSRDADEDTFAVLHGWSRRVGHYRGASEDGHPREIGMMHCFAGDEALAARYLQIGFLISIPGTVTYPDNARGQAVARSTPLAGMLIETDCPYLTPVPHRGRRNEPAYVVETARLVAQLRGVTPELVATTTAQNARRLFGLPAPTDHPPRP
jgi:TatD DNase family protein